jgi:hypothetical protein
MPNASMNFSMPGLAQAEKYDVAYQGDRIARCRAAAGEARMQSTTVMGAADLRYLAAWREVCPGFQGGYPE